MKVKDVMSTEIESVVPNKPVKDVARLIFGRGVNGVPVCEGKKLVGFVTERDILAQFYPSIQEYIEDPVHTSNFEVMEDRIPEILDLPVEKIMSKNPITISLDTPILHAQSLMFVHKVGRLPVVDDKNNLFGIISKGDIFRAVVGNQLPLEEEEGFYDWISKYYDILIDWKKRLSNEIPDLVELLKKEKVKNVLDMGSSTGEHSIALAKAGFNMFGLEQSSLMWKKEEGKAAELDKDLRKKIKFLKGHYQVLVNDLPKDIDSVLFLGNALAHILETDKNILNELSKILNPKKSVLVFQMTNLEKLFKEKNGLREFLLRKSEKENGKKHGFLTFYTKNKNLTVTRAVFESKDEKWYFRGINSKQIVPIGINEIDVMLRKLGFSKIEYYGGSFYGPLFKKPFIPLESDWLNVVAIR